MTIKILVCESNVIIWWQIVIIKKKIKNRKALREFSKLYKLNEQGKTPPKLKLQICVFKMKD